MLQDNFWHKVSRLEVCSSLELEYVPFREDDRLPILDSLQQTYMSISRTVLSVKCILFGRSDTNNFADLQRQRACCLTFRFSWHSAGNFLQVLRENVMNSGSFSSCWPAFISRPEEYSRTSSAWFCVYFRS